jgi:hypothetical protein
VTYSGYYLRRTSAENAFRICHRRGWEPALGRRFGVWVVRVELDELQPVATLAPQSGQVYGRLAANSRRTA